MTDVSGSGGLLASGLLPVASPTMSDHGEFEARTILTMALRVPVIMNDDNSKPGMVDARFTRSDGRTAVVEIFADHVQSWTEYTAFLANNRTVAAPGLQHQWWIGVLPLTKLQHKMTQWPASVLRLEDAGLTSSFDASLELREELQSIGIQHCSVRQGKPGLLVLTQAVTAEMGDPEPSSLLARFLNHLLGPAGKGRSKTDKLLNHPFPVDERHLFVWITHSSPMDIEKMLRVGPENFSAHRAPDLPEGITNVWFAGHESRTRTLEWSNIYGWHDWGEVPRNVAEAAIWQREQAR